MASENESSSGLGGARRYHWKHGHCCRESLKDIAPDLAEWIIAFSYGDVMSAGT
jgi:hypothetical protein